MDTKTKAEASKASHEPLKGAVSAEMRKAVECAPQDKLWLVHIAAAGLMVMDHAAGYVLEAAKEVSGALRYGKGCDECQKREDDSGCTKTEKPNHCGSQAGNAQLSADLGVKGWNVNKSGTYHYSPDGNCYFPVACVVCGDPALTSDTSYRAICFGCRPGKPRDERDILVAARERYLAQCRKAEAGR